MKSSSQVEDPTVNNLRQFYIGETSTSGES